MRRKIPMILTKRMLPVILSAALIFSAAGGGISMAQESGADRKALTVQRRTEDEQTVQPAIGDDQTAQTERYEELTVGTTTAPTGHFFTDLWGNGSGDLDVRHLLTGYHLILWDSREGMFSLNPTAVSGIAVTENADGDRTFRISLYEDLFYSDGRAVSARDYAFSALLQLSPEAAALGAGTERLSYLKGAQAFREGETDTLAGIRIHDDHEFSIIVDHSCLPFFYELGLLDLAPAPIHVIAPGCTVQDHGEGAVIESEAGKGERFTSSLLEKTMLDPDTGYCTHPSVSSGPYVLESFDGEEAVFSVNEYFKGDAAGLKPGIERIRFRGADNETMMRELEEGSIDLLSRVSDVNTVRQGIALVTGGGYQMSSYPRSGMSFLTFTAGSLPAASRSVRAAIACCLEKERLTQGYEGNLGIPVNGWYGIGQWTYRLLFEEVEYPPEEPGPDATEEEIAAYQTERAAYELGLDGIESYDTGDTQENIVRAVSLLTEDGWTLNEKGEAFAQESDTVRCKLIDGKLTALELTLDYPEGNRVGELFEETLIAPLAQAGIRLTIRPVQMDRLLEEYYGQAAFEDTEEGRRADLLYLATNFDLVYDPSAEFVQTEEGHSWGSTGIVDETLYELAVQTSRTEPGDLLNYCRAWTAFQERFAQVLPAIPVYSNVYFDFYRDALQGYEPAGAVSWAQAVVPAFLSDPPEKQDASEAAGQEEMEFID